MPEPHAADSGWPVTSTLAKIMKSRYIVTLIVLMVLAFLAMPSSTADGLTPVQVDVRVFDEASDKPIPDAQVVLQSAQVNRNPNIFYPSQHASGITDSKGQVILGDHFPAGWSTFRGGFTTDGATISVSARGYQETTSNVSDVKRVRYWTFFKPTIYRILKLKKNS